MAVTPKRLVPGSVLTTSWATYYTATAPVLTATIKELLLCNTDATARTFYVAIVPTSGSAAAANTIFSGVTLQASETKVLGLTDVLPTGYSIQAKVGEAGAGNLVSMTVSGMENT